MAQHDGVIDNQSRSLVRTDFNNALAAIISNFSGAVAPTPTTPFQWWLDTANNLLKLRDSSNTSWISLGTPSLSNLGLLTLSGGSLTGALLSAVGAVGAPGISFSGDSDSGFYRVSANTWGLVANGTEYLRISTTGISFLGTGSTTLPSGATSERPGSPINGMIRYNTDLSYAEAYVNGLWQKIVTDTYPFTTDSFTDIVPLSGAVGTSADFSGVDSVSKLRAIIPWSDPELLALPTPSATDGTVVCDVCFSKGGEWMAQVMNTGRAAIYKRSRKAFHRSSEVLPPGISGSSSQQGCALSNSGEFIAIGNKGTSPLYIRKRAIGTNNWTTSTTLSVDPDNTVQSLAWSHDDEFIAIAGVFTEGLLIYQRSGTTFTKLTNPATIPSTITKGIAFSPDSRFLIVCTTGSISYIYERTAGNTFTYTGSGLSGGSVNTSNIAWSPNGEFVAVTTATTTGFLKIYQRSGTTFTKLSDPSYFPSIAATGVAWSPDSRYLAISSTTSPYIIIYERSGTTFTKLNDPSVAFRSGTANRIAWSYDGQFIAQSLSNDSDVAVYNTTSNTPDSSIAIMGKLFRGGT